MQRRLSLKGRPLTVACLFCLAGTPSARAQTNNVRGAAAEQHVDILHEPEGDVGDAVSASIEDAVMRSNLADLADERNPSGDTPVYWHIPKAGGTTLEFFFSECLDLVVASEIGAIKGHDQDEELKVVEFWNDRYVNVDTAHREGIQRAARLGLAQSGLADVVISPNIYPLVEEVFSPRHRGRMFALFRHPVDRAVSLFYYLQHADWERTYNPASRNETLLEHVRSGKVENNWMMRTLLDKYNAPHFTEGDLDEAKEILRRKCLVGIMSEMEASIQRIAKYFRWGNSHMGECLTNFLTGGKESKNSFKHPHVREGSDEWNALADANYWDIQLYEYALTLFEEQGEELPVSAFDEDSTS